MPPHSCRPERPCRRRRRHFRGAEKARMSDDKSRPDRPEKAEKESWRLPSKDITPVLKGWDYESGTINVRKINGVDGMPKLQMRLDLGLLQMEMSGRPDGARPHGYESLLEYHEDQLADYKRMN